LKLGRQAASTGESAPIILNAANELAVEAFLGGSLRFDQIPDIIDAAMQQLPVTGIDSLEEVLEEDRKARQLGSELLKQRIQ
jgi:1-deoxy-D-xylulose-5-phosphate reductoisomerase